MVTRYVQRTWDREAAIKNFGITEVPWDTESGDNPEGADGWSATDLPGYHTQGHVITVAPHAPLGVTLHELAHVVLGHTTAAHSVPIYGPLDLYTFQHTNEVEAETVAQLLAEELGLSEEEHPRLKSAEYIEHYQKYGFAYPNRAKVEQAAKAILAAGNNPQG